MPDTRAFLLTDDAGAPKTDATPAFVAYKDRAGTSRTAPAITHRGGGKYVFTPSAEDETTGVAFLIDASAGASPARLAGAITRQSAPFEAWHLEDAAGALWTGAVPAFAAGAAGYCDPAGNARTAPAIITVHGACLFAFTPTAEDISADVVYRVDSPAGAFPEYVAGSIDRPDSLPAAAGTTTLEAVRAELAADATVVALVETRIYPLVMPQDATRPAIVLTVVSEVPENSFDGTAETRLTASRVQVDCYAATYLEAHEVATAADNVLANLRRPDLSAERDSMADDWDDEVQVHRVSMDFSVWR